ADGIRYEISYAGVIDQNVVQHNGFGTGRGSGGTLWDGGGINVNTSSDVQVRGNLIQDNRNALSIQSRTRGDGPRGTYVLRNVLVEGRGSNVAEQQGATGPDVRRRRAQHRHPRRDQRHRNDRHGQQPGLPVEPEPAVVDGHHVDVAFTAGEQHALVAESVADDRG